MTTIAAETLGAGRERRLWLAAAASGLALLALAGYAAATGTAGPADPDAVRPTVFLEPTETEAGR
jgi:hypothetical protein